jgi:hypothetical protein
MTLTQKLVLIRGYDYNCIPWNKNESSSDDVYCTLVGIAFEGNYIVTTRTSIIYCGKIFSEGGELRIVAQCFEWNLVILQLVIPAVDATMKTRTHTLDDFQFILPVLDKIKYTIVIAIDDEFLVSENSLKFTRCVIDKADYMPRELNCYFKMSKALSNISSTSSMQGVVFNPDHKIMGMTQCAMRNSKSELLITPSIVVYRFLMNYIENQLAFEGCLHTNFQGTFVDKKRVFKLNQDCGTSDLISGLRLLKIDGMPIFNRKNVPYVLDSMILAELPLELYIRIHCQVQKDIQFLVVGTTDEVNLFINGRSLFVHPGFAYTSIPHVIDSARTQYTYVQLNSKHVICTLNVELLLLMLTNYSIVLTNHVILDYQRKSWARLHQITSPMILIHTESAALRESLQMINLTERINSHSSKRQLQHAVPIITKVNGSECNLEQLNDILKSDLGSMVFDSQYFTENIKFTIDVKNILNY